MNAKTFKTIVLVLTAALGLVATLSGCDTLGDKDVEAWSETTPEEVVESFYGWYTGYAGNPLADGAYRSSAYLSEEFVERVDGILASFEKGAYDPFLCAQDIPQGYTVGEAAISGQEASVVLTEIWNPGTQYESHHEVQVALSSTGGEWKISNVVCGGSEVTQPVRMGPEEVTRSFYDWYLSYIGDRALGEMRNPLVDGAYRSNEHLTPAFIQKVDEILASSEHAAYDPFLCAQDIPDSFSVQDALVSGTEASTVVHTSFAGHTFTVRLQQVNEAWKIADITCNAPEPVSAMPEGPIITTPEGTVRAFYDWYLWYVREVGNPLVEEAYHANEYLSEGLVQKVDGIIASFDKSGYDPFLCAQDIPQSFNVQDAVVSGDIARAVVRTSFEGHGFTVALRRISERWEMTDVLCEVEEAAPEQAPASNDSTAGWQVFEDAEYGFRVRYPAAWTFQEVELRYPELDAPIVRVVHFLPQEWAAQMNTGGPPDPNNVIVAPLGLEVSVGTMEAYRQKYFEPFVSETVQIGGYTVTREQDVPDDGHMMRYLFQHPSNSALRVTLVDQISGFSGRVEGNEDIASTVQQMLSTFQFVE